MFMSGCVFPLLGGQTMLPKAVTPAKPATTQGLGPSSEGRASSMEISTGKMLGKPLGGIGT